MTKFQVAAIIILALFYLFYFIKSALQKQKGIRTNQIGLRKEKHLHRIEILLSTATCSVVAAQVTSILIDWSWLPDDLRIAGCAAAFLGDLVFLIAVITMRDSWRAGIPESDRTELIHSGIYAFSRNPAFLGFDLMYIGVCIAFCNYLTITFSLFAIVMLHLQILQEEKYLAQTFGKSYLDYKSHTMRYLGRK